LRHSVGLANIVGLVIWTCVEGEHINCNHAKFPYPKFINYFGRNCLADLISTVCSGNGQNDSISLIKNELRCIGKASPETRTPNEKGIWKERPLKHIQIHKRALASLVAISIFLLLASLFAWK
jgi:hypothetical protein